MEGESAEAQKTQAQALQSRSRSRVLRPATVLWLLPFAALLAFVAVWCALGLCQAQVGSVAEVVVACVLCMALVSQRERVFRLFDRLPLPVALLRDAIVLVAAAVLAFYALEVGWNREVAPFDQVFWRYEALFALLVLGALYFLSMRRGVGPAVGVAVFALIGVAQHFVLMFKGSVILPSDLYALGTAAAVSGGYRYAIDVGVLAALESAAIAWALLALVRPQRPGEHATRRRHRHTARSRVLNVALACVLAFGEWGLACIPNYERDLGVDMNYWWAIKRYQTQGMLVTFNAARQDLAVHVPAGYSEQAAANAQEELARRWREGEGAAARRAAAEKQFEQVKPSVVAIMNEAFADLSCLDGLGVGYEGPKFFNGVKDGVLMRGELAVPVFGGGTCNTEYEFLTGSALSFMGQGKYPYSMYGLEGYPSIAAQLKGLGYQTTALHPNYAANWNRDKRYAELGFDEFLDIDDFHGAPRYHNGVTDGATYDRILELLEERDGPQFFFDVTMQNHGGYDKGDAADESRGLAPAGLTADETAQLNEYLACIDRSDADLREFVEELRGLDRPVVLVMFGDHHPNLSKQLNEVICGNDENEAAHEERIFQTVYLAWANYDVAGTAGEGGGIGGAGGTGGAGGAADDTAASLLAARLLERIGAPLTECQQAELGASEVVPSFNAHGYLDANGTWHTPEEETPAKQTLDALALVEYAEYGSKLS